MTGRPAPQWDELIESCRPVPPAEPNILKALLTIQQAVGHVPVAVVPRIAHALNVTEADVAGVLSYYPDLRTEPGGRHRVLVCLGEACLANRGHRVLRAVQEHLQIGVGETTKDGRCTLEQVSCVGNCAVSPSLVIDGDLYGRVAPEQVPAMLERCR